MIWISYVDLFIDFSSPHPVSPQQPGVLGPPATAPLVMTPLATMPLVMTPPAATPLVTTPLRCSIPTRNRWGISFPHQMDLSQWICYFPPHGFVVAVTLRAEPYCWAMGHCVAVGGE